MAFADRKSIGLGGGAFSRRGIRRVDGPRGMQVTVSAEGKHYRQKSGDGLGTPPSSREGADQIIARSPDAALKQMNAVSRQPGYAGMALAGGAASVLLSFWVHLLLSGLLAGLTVAVFLRVRMADARRRRFHLEYRLDVDARERWTLLNHALAALTRTERLWQIRTRGQAQGWKQNTGAASLVTRTRVALRREVPALLTSSVTPYCLHLAPQRWLFFPDRLYVLQNGGYEAIEYAHLRIRTGTARFIEEEQVPRDAQVVGKPGPRTGFGGAQGVPITEYGVLEIEVRSGPRSGLKATLHVSSVGAADQFAGLFQSFLNFRRSDGAMPTPSPPSEGCYRRLGLTPSCTKAEAARQFRRLVLAHHPDRVSRATPDSGERANAEMQEIVLAYKDLKRLHGW